MRRIALSSELTIPHLLEWQDAQPVLRDHFAQLLLRLAQGDLMGSLELASQAYGVARQGLDRYGEALALVFRAEICRRLERWEDSLDAIRNALNWLELRVAPVAHYHEAIAVYLEGIVHFVLRSDAKVVETFTYSQSVLAESERHWGFEQNVGRVDDCRNVIRWMSQILEIQSALEPGDAVVILPVYELVNRTLVRTEAVALHSFQVTLPVEVVARYLPAGYRALQLDALSFLYVQSQAEYLAVRIPEDGAVLSQGRKGDLLVIEITAASHTDAGLVLTSDKPFFRRVDGRVEFRAVSRGSSRQAGFATTGQVGIPRILVREGDEQ